MDTLISRITALLDDQSPKAVVTIKYILAILDGKVVIPGGIKLLMAELECDGYVDPKIDDIRFPRADAFVSSESVRPVDIGKDWNEADALAFLAAMEPPMQPVMPDKGIKWASENKEAQRKNPLVILGQKCRYSGGRECFLVLSGDVRKRSAFARYYLVLAEPKE